MTVKALFYLAKDYVILVLDKETYIHKKTYNLFINNVLYKQITNIQQLSLLNHQLNTTDIALGTSTSLSKLLNIDLKNNKIELK